MTFATLVGACAPLVTPPAGQIRAPSDLITVVPFELSYGFILVVAEVNGRRGTFVLDTGSPVIVLNSEYVQRDSAGAVDTVETAQADSERQQRRVENTGQVPVTVHTVRIGTLFQHLDSLDVGPPVPVEDNTRIADESQFHVARNRPVLGFLGLPAMESFEVIIDYPHRQLLWIRLDRAGHRLAAVPLYTVASAIPLVPVQQYWWGVQGYLGITQRTLMVDTGSPVNRLTDTTRQQLRSHLVTAGTLAVPWLMQDRVLSHAVPSWALDHLILADAVFPTVPFIDGHDDLLGYPFLQQAGVVGFNFRTHQLLLYHT